RRSGPKRRRGAIHSGEAQNLRCSPHGAGTNIPIAVIDSQIDAAHPDLEGVIAERFSAVGTPEKPHAHGTGMAGAIAAHQRLLGTAPGARILAVHAFSTAAASAESTTFNILKGTTGRCAKARASSI